jgi:AbiV family abortive infection protein
MKSLSVSQIEEARSKILQNAMELVEEAELLLANGRFARAYSLSHLACEEIAKIPMLVRAATDKILGRDVDWQKLNRRLRSHTEKITGIFFVDYLIDPNIENDQDLKILQKSLDMVKDFNMLKNQSLYTNLVGNSLLKPSEAIPTELATSLVGLARKRLGFFQSIEIPTQGKIEQIAKSAEFQKLSIVLEGMDKIRKEPLKK